MGTPEMHTQTEEMGMEGNMLRIYMQPTTLAKRSLGTNLQLADAAPVTVSISVGAHCLACVPRPENDEPPHRWNRRETLGSSLNSEVHSKADTASKQPACDGMGVLDRGVRWHVPLAWGTLII